MSEELRFDDSGLGKWTEETRFVVTRERLADYAAATNDPIAAHRAGNLADPVFAIVPVFDSLIAPALDVVPLNLVGKIVHGEQDFRFARPIKPGDALVSRGKVLGYEGLPNGSKLNIYLECRDETGELVNEQYVTTFVRGFDAGSSMGTLAPDHKFPDPLRSDAPTAKFVQHIDDDQTFRYGPAAGDPMPIHLDDEFAKEMGLPGIIAHGLCTMAFTGWGLLADLADSDVTRLRRLAVRFAKPVLPGQDITTVVWTGGTVDGVTTYHFETTAGGEVVIKDGLAEIAN